MKTALFTLFMLLLTPLSIYGEEFVAGKAWVVSDNGLTMRDQPNLKGKKLITVPFLAKVELLKGIKYQPAGKQLWITEYSDAKKVEKKSRPITVEYKFGTQYGPWRRIRYNKQIGWVFGGWLHHYSEPLIPNLHFLNAIPEYFYYTRAIRDGKLRYDCFGGNPSVQITRLITPNILFDDGQEGTEYKIVKITWEKKKIIITGKTYGSKQTAEIILERSGKRYFITRPGSGRHEIFPRRDHKGAIYVDCEENP